MERRSWRRRNGDKEKETKWRNMKKAESVRGESGGGGANGRNVEVRRRGEKFGGVSRAGNQVKWRPVEVTEWRWRRTGDWRKDGGK